MRFIIDLAFLAALWFLAAFMTGSFMRVAWDVFLWWGPV